MDDLIKQLESKSFSGEDIMAVCDNKTKIITYPQIYQFKNIDDLLKPFDNVVILYETSPSYGHWVCLLKHKNKGKPYIEFFDSYGMPPDKQLTFISKEFRKQNNEAYPILSDMLIKSKYPIKYNDVQLQKLYEDVSSCGRHVAFRIVMQNIKLGRYIKLLKKSKYPPDMIVTYLTAFQ
ncbi:MAG TPA: hypothetical protein VN703_06590 [Candidatus Sulfopaludibacter sp.]|nr:hypothetical protein [Candidatus Sulfopaludibacter sp.]